MSSRSISKKIIAYYLPSNPIIVEAGAHIGRDTKKMLKEWPSCFIHAFEPVPELFSVLSTKVGTNARVHCYPYALSNTTGSATLFMSSGRSTATSSLLEPTGYKKEHPTTIFSPLEIQTITLDDWAHQYNINHIDGLWLDMQGTELLVLKAAPELLKTVSVIYTEVNFVERYKDVPLYPEIKQWLFEQGFIVAQEACSEPIWGNVLFVRKNA